MDNHPETVDAIRVLLADTTEEATPTNIILARAVLRLLESIPLEDLSTDDILAHQLLGSWLHVRGFCGCDGVYGDTPTGGSYVTFYLRGGH